MSSSPNEPPSESNTYKRGHARLLMSSFQRWTGRLLIDAEDDDASRARFATSPATQSAGWLPRLDWTRSAYSALYYLVGRHTGLLVYFPAALALLVAACSRRDGVALALLGGPAAIALFYLLWMPK